jgi:hypothetical protein
VESDPDFSKASTVLLFQIIELNQFQQVVLEQLSRDEERRCPIAKASNEVVELLSEHWAIFAPGCTFPCDICWYIINIFIDRFHIHHIPAIFLRFS